MQETISLDMFDTTDKVLIELADLVRNGLTDQLDHRLNCLSNRTEYLTSVVCYGQEKLSLLMIAAIYGHENIVRLLFKYCPPQDQVELEGIMILNNQTILEGITALYCACYQSNFDIARLLIDIGKANVNQSTFDEPYHPLLIHATRMNRLDIVKFLIENNYADINQTKSTTQAQSTALAWAVRRNYLEIVRYLLDKGADVDYYCNKKFASKFTSPLLLAVHDGNLELARTLCNAGANTNVKNKAGDNLLGIAIKMEHWSIISFLLEQSIINMDDIELGILLLIERRPLPIDMNKLYKFLQYALQQRLTIQYPKNCRQPLAIYSYQQECQTLEELNAIKHNSNRLWVEALMMLERILIPRKDPRLAKALNGYSHYLLEKNEFEKCLALWIHSFYISKHMQQTMKLSLIIRLFCKMITAEKAIPINQLIEVCHFTFYLKQTNRREQIIYDQLCLVIITAKIFEYQQITNEEKMILGKWISQLCQQWEMPSDGQTLVHLCISGSNYGNSYKNCPDTEPYLRFPNESALRLILACGRPWLDLDAVESSMNNTALHMLCHTSKNQKMIQLLLDAGAHIDYVNRFGFTPLIYATSPETKAFLKSKSTPSHLKCLCSRLIADKQMDRSVFGSTKSKLNMFITLHGSQ